MGRNTHSIEIGVPDPHVVGKGLENVQAGFDLRKKGCLLRRWSSLCNTTDYNRVQEDGVISCRRQDLCSSLVLHSSRIILPLLGENGNG
jgi:hypothetical protein